MWSFDGNEGILCGFTISLLNWDHGQINYKNFGTQLVYFLWKDESRMRRVIPFKESISSSNKNRDRKGMNNIPKNINLS